MFSFLNRFQKRHQLPDPGADASTLQLFQYFAKFSPIGAGTANQMQMTTVRYSPPMTIGVHVVVPKTAPITGIGGLQNGNIVAAPLYDRNTGVTGRGGI